MDRETMDKETMDKETMDKEEMDKEEMDSNAGHRKGNKGFFLFRWIGKGFSLLLILPIRIYQWVISPALPKTCRYHPTCSEYAIEALKVHGPLKGFIMGTKRILSCHPWGGHGHDPVPPGGTPLYTIFKSKK